MRTRMEQSRYFELCKENGAIQLAHPEFDLEYHNREWDVTKEVTILICQRKTFEITRLCIESILRFYPDINILVVDGDSQDESTLYLRYKALTTPNLELHERIGLRHSHGETMDDALKNRIKTPYALLMDSDTIVNRGNWIEDLVMQFKENPKLYATGSLMLVTRKNFGVGAPHDEDDILRYAHPSCSMFHVNTYKELKTPFNDNGSPLAHNMIEAQEKGLEIGAYPIDKYVSHRSGVSWITEHQIVWKEDYNVFIRPFVSFIVTAPQHLTALEEQTSRDFNISVKAPHISLKIWDGETKDINNQFFGIRYSVNGEYVCLLNEAVTALVPDFIQQVKLAVIEQKAPEELNVGGLVVVKRTLWHKRECLQ